MKMTFPILYGISSKGVAKCWKIRVEHCREGAEIVTEYGQVGGKIQTSRETIREGKNIGRANETTAIEQACLEANSKWKKQHDKNYSEHMPTLEDGASEPVIDKGMGKIKLNLLPMLAQKYNERKKYLVWPAYIQPKLNGVRCLVQREGNKIFFWSRKAKLYKNFNLYMEQEFLSFMKDGEILDGEMYNHGDLTFQELVSLIKDEKKPDVASLKKYVRFHCYDHPSAPGGFASRYVKWSGESVCTLEKDTHGVSGKKDREYIEWVSTYRVNNEQDVDALHGKFMEQGYEGSILRSGGSEPYNFQYRDNQLQKKKDFIDAEFKIIGAKEGTGKDEGKAIFRCQSGSKCGGSYGDGSFDVRCKGKDSLRQEQWENRKSYLGKELTVRYQCLSDDGIPIFPVGIAVRDYE